MLRNRLEKTGLLQGLSAAGYCHDNAMAKSFFATLKTKSLPPGALFSSKTEARRDIFDHLETFHNRRRRHSTVCHKSLEAAFKTIGPHLN
ncbi:MAG TPA: hypothetical protein P5016_12265 [Verrucomicrobiales bacterium]|nr:hypothetical protein [Verrucomicrobiae bacterium]HRX55285.1 hypothetical protein [Verrucomicrobiales bacterium]